MIYIEHTPLIDGEPIKESQIYNPLNSVLARSEWEDLERGTRRFESDGVYKTMHLLKNFEQASATLWEDIEEWVKPDDGPLVKRLVTRKLGEWLNPSLKTE
jgi:hypothetical protein